MDVLHEPIWYWTPPGIHREVNLNQQEALGSFSQLLSPEPSICDSPHSPNKQLQLLKRHTAPCKRSCAAEPTTASTSNAPLRPQITLPEEVPAQLPLSPSSATATTQNSSENPVRSQPPSPSAIIHHRNGLSRSCGFCGKWFQDSEYLIKHLVMEHPNQPNYCGDSRCSPVGDRRSLKRHLNNAYPHKSQDTPAYHCCCGFTQTRRDKFKKHIDNLVCGSNGRFECTCRFQVSSLSLFRRHFNTCGVGRKGRPSGKTRPVPGCGKDQL
jgi:hypothetical protein